MRYLLPLIILLFLTLSHLNVAHGQEQRSVLFQPQVGLEAPLVDKATEDVNRRISLDQPDVVNPTGLGLASAGGLAVGTIGLAGLGYGIDYLRGAVDEKVYIPVLPAFGAMIGAAVGPSVGAHIANDYRGRVLPGILVNGVLSGLAVYTAIMRPQLGRPLAIGVPIAQVGLSALFEYQTGR